MDKKLFRCCVLTETGSSVEVLILARNQFTAYLAFYLYVDDRRLLFDWSDEDLTIEEVGFIDSDNYGIS